MKIVTAWLTFGAILFVCAWVAALQPLPANLETLALSPAALGRLQGVGP